MTAQPVLLYGTTANLRSSNDRNWNSQEVAGTSVFGTDQNVTVAMESLRDAVMQGAQ
jgi:hypothetical protein